MPAVTASNSRGRYHQPNTASTHLAGCIKWLPPKEELNSLPKGFDEGGLNHPVVILSPKTQDGKVTVLIMTSFGGVELKTKHASSRKKRIEYLPVEPCDPHPDNGILLKLQNPSPGMRKNSYVHTTSRRCIRFNMLRPYERRQSVELFLHPDSYRELAAYAKFDAPVVLVPAPTPPARAATWAPTQHPPTPPPPSTRRASVQPTPQIHIPPGPPPQRLAAVRVSWQAEERRPLLPGPGRAWQAGPDTSRYVGSTRAEAAAGDDGEGRSGCSRFARFLWVVVRVAVGVLACYGVYRGYSWLTGAVAQVVGQKATALRGLGTRMWGQRQAVWGEQAALLRERAAVLREGAAVVADRIQDVVVEYGGRVAEAAADVAADVAAAAAAATAAAREDV
ncbi:hypothetical protein F4810DRAFT_710516 [Camillea tinctor]|nr:hypothetical protein F4810DRAFT_710516 [Camillea tinctor]